MNLAMIPYNPQKSVMELEDDLIKAAHDMESIGLEWADAQALMDQMDDLRRVVLADNMAPEGTASERERVGLVSESYKNHLQALHDARRDAISKKVRYGAAQALFDAIRTILTSKRALIQRGIDS